MFPFKWANFFAGSAVSKTANAALTTTANAALATTSGGALSTITDCVLSALADPELLETTSVVAEVALDTLLFSTLIDVLDATVRSSFNSDEREENDEEDEKDEKPSEKNKNPNTKQDEKNDDKQEKDEKPSKQPPRRRKSQQIDDPSSETTDTPVWQHIVDRFKRFIRFGGIIEMISERTGIPKDQVVKKGRSKFQDGTSKQGQDYHAAHVIRAGDINDLIQQQDEDLHEFLKNILGHTQVVPSWINVWHGIGGDIDRFQEQFLEELLQIDFSGNLTSENIEILTLLKNKYLSIIEKWIEKLVDGDEKEELIKAKEALEEISIGKLFKKGKGGYNGEYNDIYTNK